MATELGSGPGAGQPPIGFLYNTISGKGRQDGNLSRSAMDMMVNYPSPVNLKYLYIFLLVVIIV
jgi:hypothetical protein